MSGLKEQVGLIRGRLKDARFTRVQYQRFIDEELPRVQQQIVKLQRRREKEEELAIKLSSRKWLLRKLTAKGREEYADVTGNLKKVQSEQTRIIQDLKAMMELEDENLQRAMSEMPEDIHARMRSIMQKIDKKIELLVQKEALIQNLYIKIRPNDEALDINIEGGFPMKTRDYYDDIIIPAHTSALSPNIAPVKNSPSH